MPEELVSVKIWTAAPSLVLPKSAFEILVAAWMVVAPATSRTTATDDSANILVIPPGESYCITKRCLAVAQGLFNAEARRSGEDRGLGSSVPRARAESQRLEKCGVRTGPGRDYNGHHESDCRTGDSSGFARVCGGPDDAAGLQIGRAHV